MRNFVQGRPFFLLSKQMIINLGNNIPFLCVTRHGSAKTLAIMIYPRGLSFDKIQDSNLLVFLANRFCSHQIFSPASIRATVLSLHKDVLLYLHVCIVLLQRMPQTILKNTMEAYHWHNNRIQKSLPKDFKINRLLLEYLTQKQI